MLPDLVITALWLCVAGSAAYATARRRAPGAATALLGALLLASLHAFHWNQPIYFAGRRWVMDLGVYAERLWLKLAIGALVLLAAALAVRPAWRWLVHAEALLRVALAAIALDLGYITVRTLSIDGWMPDAIAFDPGKSALAIALALVACVTTVCSRPRAATTKGQREDGAFFLG